MHLYVFARNCNYLMFYWVHIADEALPHFNNLKPLKVRSRWQNQNQV